VKFTIAKQAEVALSPKNAIVENNEELSKEEALAQMACSLDNPDACEACGS
jgi:ribonucleoside-diphosphate reductase alpha chain